MTKLNKTLDTLSLVLFSLSFLSFFILTSNFSFAESSLASVTVASACTMTSTINSEHTADIINGTFKEDIGKTTLKVICNDAEGFSIYAVGYTDDEYGNNKLIEQSSTTSNIITGTATSGDTSNWAMKLTPITGSSAPTIENGYNAYKEVPDKYVKVATFPAVTNTTTGSSVETTYRAYVSRTQLAGTYNGKVKYTMVHPASAEPNQPYPCTAKKICYWPNGDGLVVDSMADQAYSYLGTLRTTDLINASSSVRFWPSNFKRKGYGFVGWSDKFDWTLNQNDEDGNGTGINEGYHIYGPTQTILNNDDIRAKGLSLYAVWVKSEGYLQDWNGCSVMKVGEVTGLTDKRDNETYAVAKLKDGNCWMIENLRLDNTNSDNGIGALSQGYASNFIGLASPENSFGDSTAANSIYSTNGSTAMTISGTRPGYRIPRYSNSNTADTVALLTDGDGSYDYNIYSYGNIYTWSAAVANTDYFSSSGQNLTTSICPKDWRLPSGGYDSNSDFWKLGVAIMGSDPPNGNYYNENSSMISHYPNNFVWDTYISTGTGFGWWTSTTGGDGSSTYRLRSYVFIVWGGGFYPGNGGTGSWNGTVYGRQYNALPIRCVFVGS